MSEYNKTLYFTGKIVGVAGIAATLLINIFGYDYLLLKNGCVFLRITGYPCPGCGGTRAFIMLLTGHPIMSLVYNPFVLYSFLVYLVYMIRSFVYLNFGIGKECSRRYLFTVYVGIAILLIQWVVKLCASIY